MTTNLENDDFRRADEVTASDLKKYKTEEEEEMDSCQPAAEKQNRVLAMICVTVFTMSGCLTQISFKKAEEYGVSVAEFTIFNAGVRLLLMPFVHFFTKTNPWTYPAGNKTMILARGATGLATMFAVFWSVKLIPISISMIILNLNPFWTGILGLLVNGEPFGKADLIAMLVCFMGIVGIALTGAPSGSENDVFNYYLVGVLLALFASWVIAAIMVIGRRIRAVHWAVVLTHISVQYLVVSTAIALIDHALHGKGTFLVYEDNRVYKWAVIGGLAEVCFLMAHTIALQNATGVFVSLLGYQMVAYAFLSDTIIFKTTVTNS